MCVCNGPVKLSDFQFKLRSKLGPPKLVPGHSLSRDFILVFYTQTLRGVRHTGTHLTKYRDSKSKTEHFIPVDRDW